MDITKLIDNVFDVSERHSFYVEDNAYTCYDDREQFSKQRSDARFLKAEITRLREENKRMREALKPFADRAGKLDGKWLDHETHWSPAYGSTAITIADLRRAYTVLATTGGE